MDYQAVNFSPSLFNIARAKVVALNLIAFKINFLLPLVRVGKSKRTSNQERKQRTKINKLIESYFFSFWFHQYIFTKIIICSNIKNIFYHFLLGFYFNKINKMIGNWFCTHNFFKDPKKTGLWIRNILFSILSCLLNFKENIS